MTDFDLLNGTDEFPYPVSINRTDFKNFDQSEIDEFLYKNHRFTSIDVLIKELSQLSKDLNQNLLDLVNHDYNDFINLGKSINGGLDIINDVSGDLKNFRGELLSTYKKLDTSYDIVEHALTKRQELVQMKTYAKLSLLLNDQITSFENALVNEDIDKLKRLKSLTGLYLSISNIFTFLQQPVAFNKPDLQSIQKSQNVTSYTSTDERKSGENHHLKIQSPALHLPNPLPNSYSSTSQSSSLNSPPTQIPFSPENQFIKNYLKFKISSIKYEFKTYLDHLLISVFSSPKDERYSDSILELLNLYKIIGHEKDFLEIVKENNKR